MRRAPSRPVLKNPPIPKNENLSSATECTGLIPSAVMDPAEAEHYAQLYDVPRPVPNPFSAGEKER